MPVSAQEWRVRTGLNNASRVCRPVSSSAGKWEGVSVPLMSRGVCVSGLCVLSVPLLYKTYTLVLLMLLLLSGNLDHKPGAQYMAGPEVCVSGLCVVSVPVLCMAYTLVVRMLLLLSGNVERNPGPTMIPVSEVANLVRIISPAAAKWRRLGLQLIKDSSRLDTVQANYAGQPGQVELCLQEILEFWVQNCEPTYEKLASTLCDISERDMASALCQNYGIYFPVSAAVAPLPSCLARYRETLKEQYSRFSVLPDNEWPPSVGDQFINLALIKYENKLIGPENTVEMQNDYVHGKLDKIMSYKEKITKEDIFQPVYNKRTKKQIPLCVLMDGAPGVGKTTLSRELCQEWADGKLLQNYDLVVLVHLRERNNKQAKSIEDFFYHDDKDLQKEVTDHIRKTNGDNVLLIFDGFDELSYDERTRHSVFLDVITGKVLHKCSVVVTSRPHASETLQRSKSINLHVQVLGFTEEQINDCINRTVKDQSKAEGLRTRLKERLDITSLCSIPLNCAIMLYVYQQDNFHLPNTLTELFDIFILNALKRHAKRMGIKSKLRSLDDLPPPLDSQFTALCKMAYEGLIAHKLIFSEEDLEKAFGVTDIERQFLDLLTATKSYSSRGDEVTYHFLHLTIQEFLAAKWLATVCKRSPEKVVKFFKLNHENDDLRLTLLFVAGLTKLEFPNSWEVFIHPKPDQLSVRLELQQLPLLFHCHLMFEARNNQITQWHSKGSQNLTLTPEFMTNFDFVVLAYYLSHSKSTWKLVKISETVVDTISTKSLTVKQLQLFCKGFSDCTKNDVVIEKLFFDCSGMESLLGLLDLEHIPCFCSVSVKASERCFQDKKQTHVLKVKNIYEFTVSGHLEGFGKYFVIEALNDNTNLKTFTCEVEPTAGDSIYKMLSTNKSLTSLTLVLVHQVNSKLLEDISQGLAQNSTLQKLAIFVSPHLVKQQQISIARIMKQLAKVSRQLHLKKLIIDFLPSPPDFTTNVRTRHEAEAEAVVEVLVNNASLKHVELTGFYFSHCELKVIESRLKKNKTLSELKTAYDHHRHEIEHARFVRNTESGELVLEILSTIPEMEEKLKKIEPTQTLSQCPSAASNPYTTESRIETEVIRKCGGCEKRESQETMLKRCTRCYDVAYCSKKCQGNDWPRHKPVCRRP